MNIDTLFALPGPASGPLWRTDNINVVPHAGMMMDVGDGDFREVVRVLWKDLRLEVWFEADGGPVPDLVNRGWKRKNPRA